MPGLLQEITLVTRGMIMEAVEKVERTMDTLIAEGEKASHGLSPREEIENRLVEEGVRLIKGGIDRADKVWHRAEDILIDKLSILLERLDVATTERVDVVERVSLNTREMVEELKKKVEELERRIAKGKD